MSFKELKSAVLIVWVSIFFGCLASVLLENNSLLFNYESPAERLLIAFNRNGMDRIKGIRLIDVKHLLLSPSSIVVDARSPAIYAAGHIPRAINIPRNIATDHLDDVLRGISRSSIIIVYCSGLGCDDSAIVARGLSSIGFLDVRVFEGGWNEWTREDQEALTN